MQVTTIVAIVALVLAVLALAWAFALAQRLRALTSARGDLARMAASGDFVGAATALQTQIDSLVAADARLGVDDAALSERLETSVRHVGLVRFDALPGDVGEQSFAVALLDERATGFVLTSMYGRGAYRPAKEGQPSEGVYDFFYIDHVKRMAEKHHLKLVLCWFGHYASGAGTIYANMAGDVFAPMYIIQDTARFPRAVDADGKQVLAKGGAFQQQPHQEAKNQPDDQCVRDRKTRRKGTRDQPGHDGGYLPADIAVIGDNN